MGDAKKSLDYCHYPGCNKKHVRGSVDLKIVGDLNSDVRLPFCDYHSFIVMGGRFSAKRFVIPEVLPTQDDPVGALEIVDFEVLGPCMEVEIVEQVVGAIKAMEIQKKNG